MTPDFELLARYAAQRDEAAFAQLAERHLDCVYSTALRLVAGDTHLAEDVTQAVFTDLARKAGSLRGHATLSGWLHTSARYAAANMVRTEQRRRQREQTALTMPSNSPASEPDWDQVRAVLDDSIADLSDPDRDALMLRFFERKPLAEVGAALGVSEDAARMRVDRAIDKLRSRLAARGISSTMTALGTALAQHLVGTAPSALGSRVITRALADATAMGSAGGLGVWPMITGKLGIITGIVVLVAVGLWSFRKIRQGPVPSEVPKVEAPAGRNEQPQAAAPRTAVQSEQPGRVKMTLHVINAATSEGIPNGYVRAVFFGTGGSGEVQEATTDSTGSVRIREPLDSAKTGGPNIFVVADGYVPKAVSLHGDIPASYTMKLDAGRAAGGWIINEEGEPVAGVNVRLQRIEPHKSGSENIDFQLVKIVSDEAGRWHCACIPSHYDEVRFVLTHEDYVTTLPVVRVSAVNLTNLVLVIDRGFTVSGQITDSGGVPIPNAEVGELHNFGFKRKTTSTDEHGAFVLKGVFGNYEKISERFPERTVTGAYLVRGNLGRGKPTLKLVVQSKGFAPQIQTISLDSPTNTITFKLSEGRLFRGRVLDEEGFPIPYATVRTDADSDGLVPYRWFDHTDFNGRFEWNSAPSEPVLFWFEAEGYEPYRDVRLLADGSDHEIRLKRKPSP